MRERSLSGGATTVQEFGPPPLPPEAWPETRPRDFASRCPRSGGDAEERSAARSSTRERAPQASTPEMGCMGAKDPAGFSAAPLCVRGRLLALLVRDRGLEQVP